METKKEKCRHLWHHAFSERSIESDIADLVIVGLYCPKCLTTTTLKYEVGPQRTGNEEFDNKIISKLSLETAMRVDKKLIETNLEKLGYSTDEINLILEVCLVGFMLKIDKFTSMLKSEHTLMSKAILQGELLGS